ncbi:MAG: hypothetical protein JJ920_07605 [Roseitalea sp.]|jgi:signal transduction histidine kinase|nr:hypothetical protein [Roseitalea sp.]MBO6720401.1 hypothetical protein [Roseitalea sp.]MBO6742761.1 hypothetical protein [Roseitalea sp.]
MPDNNRFLFLCLLAGLALCACFLAIAGHSAMNWPVTDGRIETRTFAIAAPETADPCGSLDRRRPLEDGKFFLYARNAPQFVAIRADDPPADAPTAIVLGPVVDRAVLYVCAGGTATDTLVSGNRVPAAERPSAGSSLGFVLSPEQARMDIVLEAHQDAMVTVPVYAFAGEAFARFERQKEAVQRFLYGAVCIMIAYNLALGFLTAQPAFGFNALVVSSMLALDLAISGFGPAHLWGELPAFYDVALFYGLAGPTLFGPLYVHAFLHGGQEKRFPGQPILAFWPLASLACIASLVIVPGWIVAFMLTALWIVMVVVICGLLIKRAFAGEDRAAIIMVPLVGAIIPPMFIGATREFAGWDYGWIGIHHTELALVLEALLFTLAVAYLMRMAAMREQEALRSVATMSNRAARRLVTAIDKERTRISMELHDTAGQGFVLIANGLAGILHKQKLARPVRSALSALESDLRITLSDLRKVSHDIHPPALDHLGLEQALAQLLKSLGINSSTSFSLACEGDVTGLTKNQSLQVFRIVQELASNIVKHANATKALVSINDEADNVTLTISDNGRWKVADARTGIGTSIVAHRVRILGGSWSTDATDQGTTIRIRFPADMPTGEADP